MPDLIATVMDNIYFMKKPKVRITLKNCALYALVLVTSLLAGCAPKSKRTVADIDPSSFRVRPWSLTTSGIYNAVAVGDLNGDQHFDIAGGSSVPGTMAIWYGKGQGGWSSPQYLPVKGDVRSIAIADFDNDGRPDLAFSIQKETKGVQIWLGRGKSVWEKGSSPVESGEFYGIRAADINSDNNVDLVCAAAGSDDRAGIKVWLGDGGGGWISEVGPTAREEYSDVAVADFNGDGRLDLAGSGRGLRGALRLWLGDGTGGWSDLPPLEPGNYYAISTADLNGDGHLDLFAGTYRSGFRVFLGDGNGVFQSIETPVQEGSFWKVIIGDASSVDFPKVFASSLDSGGIMAWRWTGKGFDEFAGFYGSTGAYYDMAVADLDGDGRQDLIAASNGQGVSIWSSLSVSGVRPPGRLPEVETVPGPTMAEEEFSYDPKQNEVFVTVDGQPRYRIGPGDVLEVSLWQGIEEQKYLITVREDGKISFTFLQDIPVSGLYAEQVDEVLSQELSRFVREPRVDVRVKEYHSKSITLLGAISVVGAGRSGPGTYVLTGRTTVLEALAEAGGPSEKANVNNVTIRRESGQTFTVNLYKTITQGDLSQNIVLDAGDTVTVPYMIETENRVFVFGEVNKPGVYPIRGKKLSIIELVSLAGGFRQTAVLGSARIVRGDLNKPEVIACDLRKILRKGDMTQNITLQDGDVVYVPKSTIGNVAAFLREIGPILQLVLYPAAVYNAYRGEQIFYSGGN
jgi:polysaccharide export outer membrane protein